MWTRRSVLAGAAATALAACGGRRATSRRPAATGGPAVISTWDFGRPANQAAWTILAASGSALDAVERGVNQAELDATNPSVGFGGLPDEEGEVTQDAMIFWGPPHAVGAVGCIKRIKRPISVARQVMERTSHTLLVGDDATRFARAVGFVEEPLLTEAARRAWEAWKADPGRPRSWNHDTLGMVALDAQGDLCAGTSTSGKAFKIKGRVGDVPIPGAGAYVDNNVGGVAATGDGDVMMRFALAFAAVELMRAGAPPDEACARSLARVEAKHYRVQACLVALRKDGAFGAAKIGEPPFTYAVKNAGVDEVRRI
jgi:N4-(beta-N-acetylglucosaminyl)-L-asparaginase